jgi:hypothetical protein
MVKFFVWVFVILVGFIVGGMVAPTFVDTNGYNAPGFWWGIIHGVFAPFTFAISLFNDSVGVYAKNNCGGWYDFGFLLGVGAFTSSSTKD